MRHPTALIHTVTTPQLFDLQYLTLLTPQVPRHDYHLPANTTRNDARWVELYRTKMYMMAQFITVQGLSWPHSLLSIYTMHLDKKYTEGVKQRTQCQFTNIFGFWKT